ncbi:MAG: nicotinate-nucleotide adenylyltransferase [Methylococcaceae bacterium]|jgi:nicotinate-nucleotide adenylyltransferase
MIGVYGGTFDPVHYGHLRTALEVSEALRLRQLRYIPCQIPPHRERPGASAGQRLGMLEAALQDAGAAVMIDTRELERPGPSFMVDTLTSLRQEIGPEQPMGLILGMDAFLGLPRWHRWQSLTTLSHLLVMQRPGYRPELPHDLDQFASTRVEITPDRLHLCPAGLIHFVEVTQLEISATRIRRCIAEGRSARYLTPDPVLAMINRLKLYQAKPGRPQP